MDSMMGCSGMVVLDHAFWLLFRVLFGGANAIDYRCYAHPL